MSEPPQQQVTSYGRLGPGDAVQLDSRTLRALAHPVRSKLLSLLREHGPSTATRLAERLELNSGATSYHLRQLAGAGLVEEDTERGTGRDRWWRSVHRATFFDPTELPDTDQEAGAVYLALIADEYARRVQRAAREFPSMPVVWQRAGDLSDFRLRLTPDESARLVRELHEVVASYRRADESEMPADAVVINTQIQVMPEPFGPPGPDTDQVAEHTAEEGDRS